MSKPDKVSANSHLTIRLLGSPQIFLNTQPLEVMRRKNRALLYFIAAHNRPLARENILTLFWPDHARTAAQQILRTMLHDLRKQLGAALQVENESFALAPSTNIDLHQFQAHLAKSGADVAILTPALELYRGDFLEGFALVDTPSFDDWMFSERDRLRLLLIQGLTKLALHFEALRLARCAWDIGARIEFRPIAGRITARRLAFALFEW